MVEYDDFKGPFSLNICKTSLRCRSEDWRGEGRYEGERGKKGS
jgi:hypothetical protein